MKKGTLFLLILLLANNIYSQNIDFNIGGTKSTNYYEEISFEFINNKIIVPVKIQGKTYRFIFDTGAPNIISQDIYDLINPKLIKSVTITDANKKEENLNVVSVDNLKLGKILFEQIPTLVYDFNSNPLFKCFGIDGFIGSNMLRNSIIQINTKKKKLIITDNKKRLSLNKKESSKIKLIGNQSSPYLWIKIMGKDSGKEQVLIDMGADGLYEISKKHYEIFKKKDIFNNISESRGASVIGLFGEVSIQSHFSLFLPKLKIKDFALKDIITVTTNDNNSRIGAKILKYGIMTIDFKNKRFYFHSNSKDNSIVESEYGFSMTLKNNKFIIGFVWDKELKEKMKYGDEIIAINDIEINESTMCNFIIGNFVTENQNNITLKIKSKKGDIFEIMIDKNYRQQCIKIIAEQQ